MSSFSPGILLRVATACSLLLTTLAAGCGRTANSGVAANAADETVRAGDSRSVLRLVSTTSTRDSGIMDVLLPEFESRYDCRVDLIAVGTGAALKLGEAGEADAVLVHARSAEETFMNAGHGVRHEPVMHNRFLIIGPKEDTAGIAGTDAVTALKRIAAGGLRFVSRGDDSGTHLRELFLWNKAGGRPEWKEYLESGQGMGATLTTADELNACTLIDQGTWLRRKGNSRLVALVTHGEHLENPYAVMVVNPDKHSSINSRLANAFADYVISEPAQRRIAGFELNGQRPFVPDRLQQETAE